MSVKKIVQCRCHAASAVVRRPPKLQCSSSYKVLGTKFKSGSLRATPTHTTHTATHTVKRLVTDISGHLCAQTFCGFAGLRQRTVILFFASFCVGCFLYEFLKITKECYSTLIDNQL